MHRGTRGDNNYQTNLAIRPVTKIAIVGATRFLCRGVRELLVNGPGVRTPRGGAGDPDGSPDWRRGGSRRRNSRNPDEVGDPPNWSKSTFPGTPPSTPGFDARDPQIWSNSRFPGFTYVGTPPRRRGGTPRRPRKPPPIGIVCRLTRANLLCFGGYALPRWTSPKCVANKREKTRNYC